MARAPRKPEAPTLTIEQKRRRIERLENCIRELEAFDPQKVQKRYNIPEVIAIETSIADALASAFGHGTPRYNLFKSATDLDQGPHIMRVEPARGRGPMPDFDAREADEARRHLSEGKQRSIPLLQQAISALQNEIADQEEVAQHIGVPLLTPEKAAPTRKIFIVHGHEGGPREAVAGFLRKIGFTPVILHEQSNQGRTIVEKFEAHADVDFAVVLLTPDDVGGSTGGQLQPRARQNVILELGYFIGKLGRKNVCAIKLGDLEIPSDIMGVVWMPFDVAWKTALARGLRDAGHEIDWNLVMGP